MVDRADDPHRHSDPFNLSLFVTAATRAYDDMSRCYYVLLAICAFVFVFIISLPDSNAASEISSINETLSQAYFYDGEMKGYQVLMGEDSGEAVGESRYNKKELLVREYCSLVQMTSCEDVAKKLDEEELVSFLLDRRSRLEAGGVGGVGRESRIPIFDQTANSADVPLIALVLLMVTFAILRLIAGNWRQAVEAVLVEADQANVPLEAVRLLSIYGIVPNLSVGRRVLGAWKIFVMSALHFIPWLLILLLLEFQAHAFSDGVAPLSYLGHFLGSSFVLLMGVAVMSDVLAVVQRVAQPTPPTCFSPTERDVVDLMGGSVSAGTVLPVLSGGADGVHQHDGRGRQC